MKKFMYIAAAALLGLTACTEDYKDWKQQEQPTQPATVTFADGSVTEVPAIDLNNLEEGQTMVKVAAIVAPSADGYTPYYTLNIGENAYDLDAEGQIPADELQAIVAEEFGRRPTEREITATVSMWVTNGSTTVKTATSAPFVIKAIPQAPIIEAAYYLTGSINGWDNTDATYKLTNDGSDPYENSKFTLRIPAPEDGGNIEFKMTPESGLGGDWSGCLAAGAEDGKFNYDNNGGNLIITADPDALFYDLTFDMLDQTWKATPVGFNPFIYEIGNESGWSEPHPLHGNGLGQYEAVIKLDGEFKFKPNKDNWDGVYLFPALAGLTLTVIAVETLGVGPVVIAVEPILSFAGASQQLSIGGGDGRNRSRTFGVGTLIFVLEDILQQFVLHRVIRLPVLLKCLNHLTRPFPFVVGVTVAIQVNIDSIGCYQLVLSYRT